MERQSTPSTSPSLKTILLAASSLLGLTESPAPLPTPTRPKDSLSTLLHRRLASFATLSDGFFPTPLLAALPLTPTGEHESALKRLTSDAALSCVVLVASHASGPHASTPASTSTAPPPPLFGSRDIKVIQMLGGVVGRWGLSARVAEGVLPSSMRDGGSKGARGTAKISEIVEEEEGAGDGLEEMVREVLEIVLLSGEERRDEGRVQLAKLVLLQLLVPLVGALVQLSSQVSDEEGAWASEALRKLCASNPPTVILATLLALLSAASNAHPWLRPALSKILSAQLLRAGGVRALLIVVVGNDDDLALSKLEMLSRLLRTQDPTLSPEAYLAIVVPQLFAILESATPPSTGPFSTAKPPPPPPPSILRAASFILTTLISTDASLLAPILHPLLHTSFHPSALPPTATSSLELDPVITSTSSLPVSLHTISTLLLHSPPSASLHPFLLAPILPALFSLSAYLTSTKADAGVQDEVGAILETWGKAGEVGEVVRGVREAVEVMEAGEEFGERLEEGGEERFYWARSEEGSVCVRWGRKEEGETMLRVEPEGIVAWVKEVARKDVAGRLFLRWLDEVQMLRNEEGIEAAKKSVLRLQLVLKMVDDMGAEILQEPTQVVAFVAHAIDASEPVSAPSQAEKVPATPKSGLGLADLKIVEDDGEEEEEHVEEDNVVPGLGPDEMIMTALTLLLAVLEANEDLNMTTTPLLSLIFDKLDGLASSSSEIVPPLAREARLVLSLRRASFFASTPSSTTDPLAASRERYQEALRLLQDPILPVRAQGLTILRSLVANREALLSTDPALLPAVLDIFVQAVEDEDSFLYLNAIQGLSSMVDVYGRQIVKRLVEVYLGGRAGRVEEVGTGDKGRRELDKRLRIGETLVQVIQRAGEAFTVLVNDLIPSLLLILRTSSLPTPLRSSALTILTTATETAPIALLPYLDLLTEACTTLLSLESRPLQPRRREVVVPPIELDSDSDTEMEEEEEVAPQLGRDGKPKRPEETPTPTSADPKHPSLRRAAILFLGMLFRTSANLAAEAPEAAGYDSRNPLGTFRISGGGGGGGGGRVGLVGREQRERARTVLRYVGETDEDSLVRHQAGEVFEEL